MGCVEEQTSSKRLPSRQPKIEFRRVQESVWALSRTHLPPGGAPSKDLQLESRSTSRTYKEYRYIVTRGGCRATAVECVRKRGRRKSEIYKKWPEQGEVLGAK